MTIVVILVVSSALVVAQAEESLGLLVNVVMIVTGCATVAVTPDQLQQCRRQGEKSGYD